MVYVDIGIKLKVSGGLHRESVKVIFVSYTARNSVFRRRISSVMNLPTICK